MAGKGAVFMGKYFGTDGFRGEANVDLTSEHAYQIGKFIGWYYGARKGRKARVVIGKDTRRSSYMFEYAIVAGLTATGADAICSTSLRRRALPMSPAWTALTAA